MPDAPDDSLLRRFLLGESPPEERERVERHLFEDPAGLERIEAVEDDLLDACARGELAAPERARVLARLAATPAGRRRLAFAEDLGRLSDGLSDTHPGFVPSLPAPPRPRTAPRVRRRAVAALAAGLAALVVAGSYSAWRHAHPAATAGATAAARPATPPLAVAVVELALATERGGDAAPPRRRIPPGTREVELRIQVDDGESYHTYRAEIRDAAGQPVAGTSSLAPRPAPGGAEIVLAVPAVRLPPGRYEVAVQGERGNGEPPEDVGFQDLTVIR